MVGVLLRIGGSQMGAHSALYAGQYVGFGFVIRFLQSIVKAHGIGAAMAFHHHTTQAQENGAIEAAWVYAFFHLCQHRFGNQTLCLAQSAAVEFTLDDLAHHFHCAFNRFQGHIANETIGHDYFYFTRENVIAFDIANEIQLTVLQQLLGFFDRAVAFDFFRTDVEQTHAW